MNADEALSLTERGGALRFDVYVKPRAAKTALGGVREGRLVVAVAAPPVEGEANDELVRALGSILGLPRRQVRIVAGQSGRSKVLEIEGLTAGELLGRLGLGPPDEGAARASGGRREVRVGSAFGRPARGAAGGRGGG